MIRQSGEHLLALINDILSYTYLVSGRIGANLLSHSVMELYNWEASRVADKVKSKQQTLQMTVEPLDLNIVTDANVVHEIVARLLDNAVKFTPSGGQIGLDAHVGDVRDTVALVVWDTGIGIGEDQIERIYAPFTQGDGRLNRQYEGIGLGLAYVRQAVDLFGGTIEVESTVGQGSRFTITFPSHPDSATIALADYLHDN
jgi:signal transduction histidine kinase